MVWGIPVAAFRPNRSSALRADWVGALLCKIAPEEAVGVHLHGHLVARGQAGGHGDHELLEVHAAVAIVLPVELPHSPLQVVQHLEGPNVPGMVVVDEVEQGAPGGLVAGVKALLYNCDSVLERLASGEGCLARGALGAEGLLATDLVTIPLVNGELTDRKDVVAVAAHAVVLGHWWSSRANHI